jgi:outer membrane immunogenic protein
MKYVWAAMLAMVGINSAVAADLAPRTYTKAPVADPAYNWTGFYFGVNAGVGLGRSLSQLTVPDAPGTFGETSRFGAAGAIGGGQLGYNWQSGQWVLGLETDLQRSGIEDSRTCGLYCHPQFVSAQFDQKLDWFGTARGRVGLATGPVLSYVTGGLAYGGVKTSIAEALPGSGGGTNFGSAGISETRTGWTIGSGVEASLGGNWTGKIEYLYLDLGTQSGALPFTTMPGQSFSSEIREHIFRAGVNYRVGGAGTYAPEPVANWTGLYLGGNAGSGTAINPSSHPGSISGLIVFDEKFNLSPDGYLGGAQIGYNWQATNWVFGLESDIQGSTQKDNGACQFACDAGLAYAKFDQRLPWFGTSRARLGYSVGSSLFYATGGLAYGEVKTSIVHTDGTITSIADFSHTKMGWTVGAGLETPLELFGLFGKNWTAKVEYLYVDLGKTSDSYVFDVALFGLETHVQEHIFRTGLNYHFNTPVVARY